jgi:hypothetical protein
MLDRKTTTYNFLDASQKDANGWPLEYSDLSHNVGKIEGRDMLVMGYDLTPKKAKAIVAEKFNIPVSDVEMVTHKHGGKMFFPSYHNQRKLYDNVYQLGAISTRRKDQKGSIMYGKLWVTATKKEIKTLEIVEY